MKTLKMINTGTYSMKLARVVVSIIFGAVTVGLITSCSSNLPTASRNELKVRETALSSPLVNRQIPSAINSPLPSTVDSRASIPLSFPTPSSPRPSSGRARVTGKVAGKDGKFLSSSRIWVSRAYGELQNKERPLAIVFGQNDRGATVAMDGTFILDDIVPGQYALVVQPLGKPGTFLQANVDVRKGGPYLVPAADQIVDVGTVTVEIESTKGP